MLRLCSRTKPSSVMPGLPRQLDRQARRRRDRGHDRNRRQPRLLDDLERHPPADHRARPGRPRHSVCQQQRADRLVDGVVAADVLGGREQRAVAREDRGAVQAAGLVEVDCRARRRSGSARITATSMVQSSGSGAMPARSSSIVARPQTPHELLAITWRRFSSIAGTRAAASPTQEHVDDMMRLASGRDGGSARRRRCRRRIG